MNCLPFLSVCGLEGDKVMSQPHPHLAGGSEEVGSRTANRALKMIGAHRGTPLLHAHC